MTETSSLRAIGMNDEQATCGLCGKIELRGTVIVVDEEGAEIGRYGTTCVSKILGRKVTRRDAVLIETARRSDVRDDLRHALVHFKAGDLDSARWYVLEARRWHGLHRADELALAAKIELARCAD